MTEPHETTTSAPRFARREWPHWIAIAGMLGASAYAWGRVTLPIPTHWNIRGEVDGTGGRFEGLLLVPLIAAGMHALLIATALGYDVDAGRWIPGGVGLLFIVLGNVMGKVRPNYFVGIRTPWTLSSARSWEKTHRMGGRIFVLAGVGMVIGAIVQQPWFFAALGALGACALAWLFYYSYAEWRVDPERVPVTGTRPARDDR